MTEIMHADDGIRAVRAYVEDSGDYIQIIMRVPVRDAILRSMTRGTQPAPLCYAQHLADTIKNGGAS